MSKYLVIDILGKLYAIREEETMEIFELQSLIKFPIFKDSPVAGIALFHGEAIAVINTPELLETQVDENNFRYAVAVGSDEPIFAFTLNPSKCYVLSSNEIEKMAKVDEKFCDEVFYTEKGVIHLINIKKVAEFLEKLINNFSGG